MLKHYGMYTDFFLGTFRSDLSMPEHENAQIKGAPLM